jgi:hypothetical protein
MDSGHRWTAPWRQEIVLAAEVSASLPTGFDRAQRRQTSPSRLLEKMSEGIAFSYKNLPGITVFEKLLLLTATYEARLSRRKGHEPFRPAAAPI